MSTHEDKMYIWYIIYSIECIHESRWMILLKVETLFDTFLDMMVLRRQEELEDKPGIWEYLFFLNFSKKKFFGSHAATNY